MRRQWSVHTRIPLDANDKLIQTRPHVRNTIASRKRRFVMRKGKCTILAYCRLVVLKREPASPGGINKISRGEHVFIRSKACKI